MKRPLQKMPVKLNMLLAKNLLRQYKNTGCKFLITLGQNFIHIKHHAKTILPLWDEPSDDFLLSILRNHQSICAILVLESKSKESRVYSTSERTYICCDLKSLYISMGVLRTVWAPLATNLTVAYLSRTEKAIVLTVISFRINLIEQ